MAFVHAPGGFVTRAYVLSITCPTRQTIVAVSEKTRRRRSPVPRSTTAILENAVPAIASDSGPVEIEPELPNELMSHSLLTPTQERDLLLQVRFLHDVQEATDSLKHRIKRDPTDAMVADALLLTEDEMQRQRHRAIQARNRMVTGNVRLVSMIAESVYRTSVSRAHTGAIAEAAGVSRSDLIQEGCIALIRAVERFDYHQGVRFSTYAARAVWSACNRVAVPVSCIVTLPERLRRAARRVHTTMADAEISVNIEGEELENGSNTTNSVGDYNKTKKSSEYIPDHLVRLVRQHLKSGISLDESALPSKAGDKRVTYGDLLVCPRPQPHEIVEHDMMLAEIRTACYDTLPEREANILVLRFGLNGRPPLSSKRIAELHKITTARVSQLIAVARNALREKAPYLEQLLHEL